MSLRVNLTHMSGPLDGLALCIEARGEPAQVTFSRAATCDVALTDDPEISRVTHGYTGLKAVD